MPGPTRQDVARETRYCPAVRGLAGFGAVRFALAALSDFRLAVAVRNIFGFERTIAGLGFAGVRATAGVTSGSGRKCARHSGLSCALLRIMHPVIRSMSGISELQSRKASPEHACCCSGVYAQAVPGSTPTQDRARPSQASLPAIRATIMASPILEICSR